MKKISGACADCPDIEADQGSRKKSDIGENGKAPADTGIMREKLDVERLQQAAQGVCLAGEERLGDAEEMRADLAFQARVADRLKGRHCLHQRFTGAAGF